jgi:hypothetical protein
MNKKNKQENKTLYQAAIIKFYNTNKSKYLREAFKLILEGKVKVSFTDKQ